MSKINDFCLIGSLKVLIAASSDRILRVFAIEVKTEESKSEVGDIGDVQLVLKGKLLKKSDSRSLQVFFDIKRSLLLVLSTDNKLEIFKVLGSHKQEPILKKLVKNEKKASVKRTHSEAMDS